VKHHFNVQQCCDPAGAECWAGWRWYRRSGSSRRSARRRTTWKRPRHSKRLHPDPNSVAQHQPSAWPLALDRPPISSQCSMLLCGVLPLHAPQKLSMTLALAAAGRRSGRRSWQTRRRRLRRTARRWRRTRCSRSAPCQRARWVENVYKTLNTGVASVLLDPEYYVDCTCSAPRRRVRSCWMCC
jgi:hypothetical protein